MVLDISSLSISIFTPSPSSNLLKVLPASPTISFSASLITFKDFLVTGLPFRVSISALALPPFLAIAFNSSIVYTASFNILSPTSTYLFPGKSFLPSLIFTF